MQKFYKVFLIVFIVVIAINIYAIDWNSEISSEDNIKYVISIIAGVIGLFVLFILNTWSKIGVKK
ncbi:MULTISPECIES: hypothetical protein [Chryseobacterium]|jgi:uncharacterized membrane protein YhaH (DUF805 family)|uniref:Uncharacterized protein n=2 Tax=Chryseobacterium aquaticum TaxID=452084 RepID=A0A0Q3LMU0_9FLAO|nr:MULTISPECIES: hypothetical protein [Chryseobacterium]KNB61453.1 hypothetical protein AC804_08790 [Chryseobacterium sp. Hurlbut01]KQK24617.1 hypothetical protein AR438_15650 [Chryseobacterium aquaticum]KUJ55044.1 hypothetical protein AR686_15975 [Chryseobacterium aquaticum subsp. greenlandense]NMR34525.1 hypothetical protein [Chryseobacterium aquaticum]NRQ46490.1 hypothetical protein [Chryseobacterium sp. C-204]